MPKEYVVEIGDGSRHAVEALQQRSEGSPFVHYLYAGATLGRIRQYADAAPAGAAVYVINGPSRGRELEALPVSPPVNRDVPMVSGPLGLSAIVGDVLTCTMGNWEGDPAGYAYAWASDGIPNTAAGATYTTIAPDAGHVITCVVTATNAAGSTEAPPSNGVLVAESQLQQRGRY